MRNGLALIGLWGSILYFNGAVGLGSISSFVLYSRKFSGPINEIANIFNEIYSALAASERIFRLLDEEEETADIIDAYSLDEDYKRYYPYGSLASKVLGFTGGDNQGIIGLEVKYEEYLKGQEGTILTVTDAKGEATDPDINNKFINFYQDPRLQSLMTDAETQYAIEKMDKDKRLYYMQ